MLISNITQSVSRTLRSAGRQVYHYGHYLVSSSSYKAPKAIEIQLRSIALPLLTGSLLLYNYGEEQSHHGDTKRWFRLLTDSTVAFLMMDWAKGLYPIAGIITGAYRAGKSGDTVLDKVREMINTASTFVAGWFGVYLGRNLFTEPGNEFEAMELRNLLSGKVKDKTLIEALKASKDAKVSRLGRTLAFLNTRLEKLYKDSGAVKKMEGRQYQRLKQSIETLMQHTHSRIEALSEAGKLRNLFPAGGDLTPLWQKLTRQVKLSQEWYAKFSRTVNPICCFLLAATFVGTPVALSTNKLIEKLFPGLKHKLVPKMFPLPGSILRGPKAPHGEGHGASSDHGLPSSGIETPNLYINGVGTLH